ncbi:MAG: hypothetical protein PHX65_08855 [Sulfurimonas sp.]|nr:hypothetical protein [Sulfurimonas sp.]
MVEIISQHVDTLKQHYYVSKYIEDVEFKKYLSIVDDLTFLKKEAQTKNNDYSSESVTIDFGIHKFNVLPNSITGFSVVMSNSDITIALRKSKTIVSSSPLIKVEFRSEFLARRGYMQCIKIVNNFIKEHIISDYKVKISELHLATDIQGYQFSHLDFFRVKTRARTAQTHEDVTEYAKASVYGGLTTFSGFTFGGGNYHLRVYNKTLEITKKKQKAFAKPLLWEGKSNYDENKTVWRVEIQFRREKLKKLINYDNTTLDDYETTLNSIPALWDKALTDYRIMDIDDETCFDLLRGKRTFKNGNERLLTKNSIYAIFKRADTFSFWQDMKIWNGYYQSGVKTAFDVPKNGSLDYVSNSIKSLFSTMAKHYGSISSDTLIKAFVDSNNKSFKDKEISLIEDSINKQLDWFERIEFFKSNGVVSVPDYRDLEKSIYSTVSKATDNIYDVSFSPDIYERLDSRAIFNNKGGL